VGDHVLFHLGLVEVLEAEPSFEVVGNAATAKELIDKATVAMPDVVLLDIHLPDGSGAEACRQILAKTPQTKVLMLTSHDSANDVLGSIMCGALGYILRQTEPDELISAVKQVAAGESFLDPRLTHDVFDLIRGRRNKQASLETLSLRERTIVPLVAEGKTNKEIAAILHISFHTVKAHVSLALQKLGLTHRSELARLFASSKTVPPDIGGLGA
jgi:DNA-binding NarL/FixJ family response regulator